MSWFFLTLFSVAFWGIAQVCIKKGFSSLSPLWSAIIGGLSYLVIYIPFALYHGVTFSIPPLTFLLLIFISVLYIFFYYVIEKGELSLTGTVFSAYPAVVVLLSTLFLREQLSGLQIALLFLILAGGVLISYAPSSKKHLFYSGWVLWAIFGALTTGFGDFLAKVSLSSITVNTYLFYFSISYLIATGSFFIFDKKGRHLPKEINFSQMKMTIVGVVLLSIGFLFFNLALSKGPASLVTSISSGYIAVTVICAYIFLKERITIRQAIGIILIIVSIAGIGL